MPGFRTLAAMRWSDMDALGHVHNARFMEYYEAARTDLVQRLLSTLGGAEVGLVVRRHEVDYLRPLVFRGEPIAIDTVVDSIGRTSFTLAHTACEPDGTVTYGRSRTVLVAVDPNDGTGVPLSESLRAALSEFTGTIDGGESSP